MKSKNILEIFEANQQYKTCNIEFEPFGGAEDGVDFRPVLDMKEQNIQLRQKLETLIAFIKGEWQNCVALIKIGTRKKVLQLKAFAIDLTKLKQSFKKRIRGLFIARY